MDLLVTKYHNTTNHIKVNPNPMKSVASTLQLGEPAADLLNDIRAGVDRCWDVQLGAWGQAAGSDTEVLRSAIGSIS